MTSHIEDDLRSDTAPRWTIYAWAVCTADGTLIDLKYHDTAYHMPSVFADPSVAHEWAETIHASPVTRKITGVPVVRRVVISTLDDESSEDSE